MIGNVVLAAYGFLDSAVSSELGFGEQIEDFHFLAFSCSSFFFWLFNCQRLLYTVKLIRASELSERPWLERLIRRIDTVLNRFNSESWETAMIDQEVSSLVFEKCIWNKDSLLIFFIYLMKECITIQLFHISWSLPILCNLQNNFSPHFWILFSPKVPSSAISTSRRRSSTCCCSYLSPIFIIMNSKSDLWSRPVPSSS